MLEQSPNSKWQSTTVQVPTSNLLVAFETQPTASNQDALDSLVDRGTSLFDFKRLWLLASFLCCVLYVVCTRYPRYGHTAAMFLGCGAIDTTTDQVGLKEALKKDSKLLTRKSLLA